MKRGAKNTSQLFMRLPPELLEAVEAAAIANSMGLSEYVRRCLFEKVNVTETTFNSHFFINRTSRGFRE